MLAEHRGWAEIIWEYHQLRHTPVKADVMLALGTNDLRVAEHALDLYQGGMARVIVCTGGIAHQHDLLATKWTKPESEMYAEVLRKGGVEAEALLLESRASNTSENIRFARALLAEKGVHPKNILIAVKPFMQRRAAATMAVEWPEMPFSVSSWQTSFSDYCAGDLTMEKVTNIMMGDLQRIWIYAGKGFSAHQRIPTQVTEAFERLRESGYTHHLLQENGQRME